MSNKARYTNKAIIPTAAVASSLEKLPLCINTPPRQIQRTEFISAPNFNRLSVIRHF